jgi:hypothetical protein
VGDAIGEPGKLPERYTMSVLFCLIRFCERFGLDPFARVDTLTPGQVAVAMEYERIRSLQEAAR